ncbi:TonB-dependent receptor plug domain-containing protein [Dyadobacter sp. CY312]|uniref:TonB-dependent receptor plug domain-containing protein n=1 Tax=Dyadobacter sp. CY312 TaxID=2907303 RepID=UPI001F39DF83|nr:TonB-dependent receptor plug domain-containing protein [Dyadobacter sp. CY312]MCE7044275.1 TonB-dependent receptor plug domain-containing protein [Dyadobacter sp. CY312]
MSFLRLKKLWFIPIVALLFTAFQYADEDFGRRITEQLQKFRAVYPQEKAYLHLDKPYYTLGDTLWFKGYLVDGALHQSDSASQVLYVDLIEQRTGKNVAQRRVRLDGGVGYGDITLAAPLPYGAYTIRAYTNWMRNFSEDYFFEKDIYIFDNEIHPEPVSNEVLDVQFFPEGGQLLSGISSRLAFKAVNGNGLGADVNGFIFDQNKDTIVSFKSEHLGLGRIQFTPEKGKKYTAYVRKKGGQLQQFELPQVSDNGYALLVDNSSSPSAMRILVYNNAPDGKERNVHVVGHSRGIVAFVAKGKVSSKSLRLNLNKKDLPEGITHLTLFDDQNRPVCERLVFIDHNSRLQVKVNMDKKSYKPREKTEMEIMVTDTSGNPVEANLSVAVTDAGQIAQQPFSNDLVSYLLLTSDLKGFVEQPSYYFDQTKTERKLHMDYLMMTQGWSRFTWQDVMRDSLPAPKRYVEQGITLAGQVKRNNRAVSEKVMLSIFLYSDSVSTMLAQETNEMGFFEIHNMIFTDSLSARLQGMNKKGNQNLSFLINLFEPPKTTIVKVPFYPVTVEAEQLKAYLKRAEEYQEIVRKVRANREKLLNEVTIKGKKEVERDTRKLYSNADATIKVTQQMASSAFSVLDMLAGRVAGVQVTGQGMNASVSIRGNQGEPQFVLDGMPVEKDLVTSLNVNDIESIDVLKGASAAIYGSRGGNGVIAIYTKRGNVNYDYSQEVVPGVLVTSIAGYNTPRVFYMPRYDVTRQEDARPDFRSTVFWAPMLRTGKDGKVKVSYFGSDAVAPMDVRANVLSSDGRVGAVRYEYSVQ